MRPESLPWVLKDFRELKNSAVIPFNVVGRMSFYGQGRTTESDPKGELQLVLLLTLGQRVKQR